MADARFSIGGYVAAFKALLPPGRAWNADPGSVIDGVVNGLCQTFVRLDARAQTLLADAFPSTAIELLPEWEESLGLPDPCAGPAAGIPQRQGQVVARLTDSGGQSVSHFQALAAALGYVVSIRENAPSRFGVGFSRPFGGTDWAFVWTVVAPLNTVTRFQFGRSAFGDPFAAWGNAVLECELRARAPTHTILQFSYVPTLDFSIPDDSIYLSLL